MAETLLRGATLADGTRGDVRLADGQIVAVGDTGGLDHADGDGDKDVVVVDLDGYVLLPAAVEPHAHLDKAFLADVVPNATGDLLGAIDAMHRHRRTVDETAARAERAARLMAANGYTAVRTHADTHIGHDLISVVALAEVRRRVADVIDVQVVALAGWPVTGRDGADQRALLREAMAAGADLVGGCPHLDDAGTAAATDVLLGIAADHGTGVDLHVDETLDPDVLGLADLVALVVSTGFEHAVTASHCVSLGVQPVERQREVAAAVAAAGVAIVALPHTNLFLQGRDHQRAMPRGVTAVRSLREAGVVVAAGADNLQDPFNPMGRACPLETAALMVLTTHLSPTDAYGCVSDAARSVLGMPPVTIAPGASADLLAVRAGSVREAVAMGPSAPGDRLVWRAGDRQPPAPVGSPES